MLVCTHSKTFLKLKVSGKTNPPSVKAGYGPECNPILYVDETVRPLKVNVSTNVSTKRN